MVTISGLPWLKGESKEISVSNLTAKILCRTHNTALSRLDLESKRFRRTIEKIDAEQNRLKKKVFRWDPSITHDISGPLLERWVAKTCVNLFAANNKNSIWALNGKPAMTPPEHVVRCIFGEETFKYPMGLYFAVLDNESIHTQEMVSTNFIGTDKGISGALVEICQYRFLIWLDTNRDISFTTKEGFHFDQKAKANAYRMEKWDFSITASGFRVIAQKLMFRGFKDGEIVP